MQLLYAFLPALCWSLVNVGDSVIMRVFRVPATIVYGVQSLVLLGLFIAAGVRVDLAIAHVPWLIVIGIFTYLAPVFYLYTLRKVDSSVINIAWAFQALILLIAGVFWFQESFGFWQAAGAGGIFAGVFLLSLWSFHGRIVRTMVMLFVCGALYVPILLALKISVDGGADIFASLFWTLVPRELCSCVVLAYYSYRHPQWRYSLRGVWFQFMALSIFVGMTGFMGWVTTQIAFARAPLTLVSVIGNTQPFIMMAMAWVLLQCVPRYAPREVLTAQTVPAKLVSFGLVFLGLVLLGIG